MFCSILFPTMVFGRSFFFPPFLPSFISFILSLALPLFSYIYTFHIYIPYIYIFHIYIYIPYIYIYIYVYIYIFRVYIYMYVCIYIYIYIFRIYMECVYIHKKWSLTLRNLYVGSQEVLFIRKWCFKLSQIYRA